MFAAGVDEMQKHAAALDMAEEMIAEAEALMGALDQPGNIGEHEFAAVAGDDAELRMQGREGIVGDLRLGGGDRGEEGRFAGVGQTDEAGVGDELQPQPDRALLARLAGIGAARRLIGRRLEMRIAETAIAAAPDDALPDLGQIGEKRLRSSSSKIWVPTGTFRIASAPLPPARFLPMPCVPVLALKCC